MIFTFDSQHVLINCEMNFKDCLITTHEQNNLWNQFDLRKCAWYCAKGVPKLWVLDCLYLVSVPDVRFLL